MRYIIPIILMLALISMKLFGQTPDPPSIDNVTMSSSFSDFAEVKAAVEATMHETTIKGTASYAVEWWDGDSYEPESSGDFWDPNKPTYSTSYYDDDVYIEGIASKGNGSFRVEFQIVDDNGSDDDGYYSFSVTDNTAPSAPSNFDYSGNDANNHPIFTWDANTEIDLDGYNIYRKKMGEQNFTKLNASLITGTTYTDLTVTYLVDGACAEYILKAVDEVANESSRSDYALVGIVPSKPVVFSDDKNAAPSEYSLSQAYPNPFNPSTNIQFGLPDDSNVKIQVFNLQGQIIATLADGAFAAGFHSVKFEASSSLSSGVYFYKIESGNFTDIKRMLLIK